MKKLKFMQNSYCKEEWKIGTKIVPVSVVTTMKKLEVYLKGKKIAGAGVIREKDFDYNSLLAFARHQSGSQINY